MTHRSLNPLTWLAVALVVAIGLMVVLGAVTMNAYGGYYGMMGGTSWAWGVVMMAVPGAVLVLILLAAIGGLGDPSFAHGPSAPLASPLDVLDQRYARGELSRDEYLRARADLGQGRIHS